MQLLQPCFALLISIPRFNSANFYQNRSKIKFFFSKKFKIFKHWGFRPNTARSSSRVNNDNNWLLRTVTSFNFARSQSIFLYALPKGWNSLLLSLRKIKTLSLFKNRLKAYYLNLVFEDEATVCCQYFAIYYCRINISVVY